MQDINKETSDSLSLPVKVKVEPESSCDDAGDHGTETELPPTWQYGTIVPKTEQESEVCLIGGWGSEMVILLYSTSSLETSLVRDGSSVTG